MILALSCDRGSFILANYLVDRRGALGHKPSVWVRMPLPGVGERFILADYLVDPRGTPGRKPSVWVGMLLPAVGEKQSCHSDRQLVKVGGFDEND